MEKYKIYSLDYLCNDELTEDDLHYIFDTKSLLYSLIISMFRCAGKTEESDEYIITICKRYDDWMLRNTWTKQQFNTFKSKLKDVYKNVYQYRDMTAEQKADWFMFQYSLNIK